MAGKDTPNLESPLVLLRLEAGITQKKLAEEMGVSQQTIRNWEQGKIEGKFTLRQTKKLCKLFGKTLEEMPDSLAN